MQTASVNRPAVNPAPMHQDRLTQSAGFTHTVDEAGGRSRMNEVLVRIVNHRCL